MTNREKFKEIYGNEPNERCYPEKCIDCPTKPNELLCLHNWWNSEYKEAKK